MRMRQDNDGQMSIDFLIGVTVFIMAFLFLMIAIPSMFTPFQSNSDELTMVADRVASSLIEKDLVATNSAGEPMPGIISTAKVSLLEGELEDASGKEKLPDGENKRIALGLAYEDPNVDPLNTQFKVYHIQVEFIEFEDSDGIALDVNNVHTFPSQVEIGSQNVGQSRRFVYLRDPVPAGNNAKYWPGIKTMMVVRVWQY